jgi:uncharacterized protein (DUF885 family)
MSSLPEIDRRSLLAGGAAGAFALSLPAVARSAAPAADPLLERAADALLTLRPQDATGNGLDTGARAGLRARLPDISQAGLDRVTAFAKDTKAKLAATRDPSIFRASLAYSCDRAIEGAGFGYGGGAPDGIQGGAKPYVVTQQDGAITFYPEFLNSQHPIETKADADAYLARVSGLGRLLDQESARIAADAGKGVVPPAFIAANAAGILAQFRKMPAADQSLVRSLGDRATKARIAGDWSARCATIVERDVYPALDRQIAAFGKATANAGTDPSVARLPQGEAYYRFALRLGTTTDQTPDEVHRIGLAQNEELKGRMDAILKAQGLTKGSVGARAVSLNSEPRFLFPNTDRGRADLLAYINGRIAAIRPLLPRLSHLPLKAQVTAKRVPVDIQDGAALGYMNFASRDGKRPAIYYVNLKSTELWPKYQLSTLTAHEGVPGHTWQGAYIAETPGVPTMVSLLGFNAFVEGWALYAEQLVDELGLYADDPFGRLGYLQAQQFRACRLVADTGLHAQGWSRDKAIAFLVAETGRGEAAMRSEVDRYCASPGQACGYKTGHNEIIRLRAKAQAALGPKFDLAGFDDALVETCGVPLALLPGVVDRWVAGRKA